MDVLKELDRFMDENTPSVEEVANKVKGIMSATGKGFDDIGPEIKRAFPYFGASWWEKNWDEIVSYLS